MILRFVLFFYVLFIISISDVYRLNRLFREEQTLKVSIFITCVCDIFASNVGKDTVELLENLGCSVEFPFNQTCCGQPAYNSGYLRESKKAMKQMIKVFEDSEYVVSPSGSCIAMIHQYPKIFEDDPVLQKQAENLVSKSYEITQFIVDVLGVVDVGSTFQGKVTYHPSCHMTRLLGVRDQPITLLKNVKGIELVDLPLKEDCCGFGGTFAVNNSIISTEMVKEKTRHISDTGANYLIGGDMACLMNIGGRLSREMKEVKIAHITEILNYR